MILSESDHEAGRTQTHWTDEQREHLARLIREGAKILYWCSDAHGRPANHSLDCMDARMWTARPGMTQKLSVSEVSICGPNALHGTIAPHKWKGVRVWMVGLVGALDSEEDKFGALQREIIGEILPEECLDASIAVRIGRKDLSGADLSGADLSGADLSGAYSGESNAPPEGWKKTSTNHLERISL